MGSAGSQSRSGTFDAAGLPLPPFRDADGRSSIDDGSVPASEHARIAELNKAIRERGSRRDDVVDRVSGWPFDQFWFGSWRAETVEFDRPALIDWVCCAELWPDDPRADEQPPTADKPNVNANANANDA